MTSAPVLRRHAIVVVLLLTGTAEALRRAGEPRGELSWLLLTTLLPAALLWWRRQRPLIVVAGISVLFALYPVPDDRAPEVLVQALTLLLATYFVAAHGERRTALVGLAVAVAGGTAHAAGLSEYDAASVAVNALWALPVWVAGRAVWVREQRATEAERRAEAVEVEAAAAERRRIARELHDVVAHGVTVMVLQARGARHCLDADTTAVRDALLAVEQVGAQALQELRRLLQVLPQDTVEAVDPRPGLAQVPALVDAVRRAGLDVELRVEGQPADLAAGVDMSAYRVLQEALTNALRYGTGGARALIEHSDGELRLEVVNPLPRVAVPAQGGGRGLVGSRERVAVFGGRFEASAGDGEFRVVAVLPREPVT